MSWTHLLKLICRLGLVVCLSSLIACKRGGGGEENSEFFRVMNSGKNYYEQNEGAKAAELFRQAIVLQPTSADAFLNLANALLLTGEIDGCVAAAGEALKLDHNLAAAYYVTGCAELRRQKFTEASKALQTAAELEPNTSAIPFQLGLAYFGLRQWEEASKQFQSVVDLEPEHPAAFYNLGQSLARLNQTADAERHLETHRQLLAKRNGQAPNLAALEKSQFTAMRVPFKLEQPAVDGLSIKMVDATQTALGKDASFYAGPFGVMDINQRGQNDLFVWQPGAGFRLLWNSNGVFAARAPAFGGTNDGRYRKCLVADLQNDRIEDVVVLGENESRVFRFATNGVPTDVTGITRLKGLAATDGALVDLDFTGKLDLLVLTARTNELRFFRNLGNFYFRDATATSGIPSGVKAEMVQLEDWNGDDMMDVMFAQPGQPPQLLMKRRGGPWYGTNTAQAWPAASMVAAADLNNDLRTDTVLASGTTLHIIFGSLGAEAKPTAVELSTGTLSVRAIVLADYDNDGWLDIFAYGDGGVRLFRNLGRAGFRDVTASVGLHGLKDGVTQARWVDIDHDGDSDLVLALKGGGLRVWRNDGGNANHQMKVRLYGNRSNSGGIGVKVESTAAGLRTTRMAHQYPVEIGTGQQTQLDSVTVRWFDLAVPSVDVKFDKNPIQLTELIMPTGSCPYLYVWDGTEYRFVTDCLGASPLGLPAFEGVMIDPDAFEQVWLGNRSNVVPHDGAIELQITEELREVLYLDEAKLLSVEHPEGTEVHTTSKLRAKGPYPKPQLITLGHRRSLLHAETLDGADVTAKLIEADRQMVSPIQLREPQLRGLAEPHGVVLDFGPLTNDRPLVLAMTGWLRFGGGMANMSASRHAEFPFPFPQLEVETVAGKWTKLDIEVGAPAGKTKTILIDLSGLLPAGAQRLRLTAAFEIHWDRAAMFEKVGESDTRVVTLSPNSSFLRWRGFSEFANLPADQPLSPVYENVRPNPLWRITPSGWATRYGDVRPLINATDNASALICGGDALALRFDVRSQAQPAPGRTIDYFLHCVGWDKDSDFHVAAGDRIEPTPWHGMNAQSYGQESAPAGVDPGWKETWNTRWVGEQTLTRKSAGRAAKK